jgi:hypothetical protein
MLNVTILQDTTLYRKYAKTYTEVCLQTEHKQYHLQM